MSTEIRPAHSPLGASSAERWMNCPGSVALLKDLHLPETDEPDYRAEGTAAHEAAAHCLNNGLDAWEVVGQTFNNIEIGQEIADAIQVFLDECRAHEVEGAKTYTEFGIDAPEFHPQFYGTLDRGTVVGPLMVIRDYKHGEGIMVDVEENPQIMYYAYGLLRHHPEVVDVSLGIVQPRGYHPDGPIRVWMTTAEHIRDWAENTLKPAMMRTALDNDLDVGPWCRFCPAKLVCPVLFSMFRAAMLADPKEVILRTNESADRDWKYLKGVEHYIKASKEDILARLNRGVVMENCKLVPKKADRVFKDGALEVLTAKLGTDGLYTVPEFKTPAQIEKISPAAKKLVQEYAYTPQTGLTVAGMDDKRPAVKVMTTKEAFPQAEALAAAQAME